MRDMLSKVVDKIAIHASYTRVFSTPDGERILRHILKEAGAYKSTFVAGDPHMTSFNEGRRNMALSIAKFALRDHNKMLEMVEKGLKDE
jgi:hypothetical protein